MNIHNHKSNITDVKIRQSCKPFGVIDESECFGDWYMQWKEAKQRYSLSLPVAAFTDCIGAWIAISPQ